MARRKNLSPLFEIIRSPNGVSHARIELPPWLRQQTPAEVQAERQSRQASDQDRSQAPDHGIRGQTPPEPSPTAEVREKAAKPPSRKAAARKPAVAQQPPEPAEPSPPQAPDRDEGRAQRHQPPPATPAAEGPLSISATVTEASSWLKQPVQFRLSRMGWAIIAGCGMTLLLMCYLVAFRLGYNTAAPPARSYEASSRSLEEARRRPVNPQLIPPTVAGVESQRAGTRSAPSARPPAPAPAHDGLIDDPAEDPRRPGLNYFRLATIPTSSAEEGLAAVQYLQENGVDAALAPTNNGQSLKLIALRGFARPNSDPEARRYEQRLRMLGRQWKARHRGWSNWSDLLAEKHRPGDS